jgi:5'-nucleotidase
MRILITNDDGVFAPGIAALARGLWAALGDRHDLVVVAPMVDHSGAGAAVGRVYERESIPYEEVDLPGLAHVPTFGIDGPPALAVIVACIEGFGPRPDLVVSGINHGVNAGRSALHSGTVGAGAWPSASPGVRTRCPGRRRWDWPPPSCRRWPGHPRPPCSTSTCPR